MTYNLPVDWDAMQHITVAVLKEDLESLRKNWNDVYGDNKVKVFSHNRDDDLEQISEHIGAFKKLIKYYGGTTE